MKATSRDLLTRVLADAPIEEIVETVRSIVQQRVLEDHTIDFKAGALLAEPHCAETLRAMVCGFANAEGGVLVLGVSELGPEGERTGRAQGFATCPPNAAETVARALPQVLAARPVVRPLAIDDALIVLVAVPRSPTLISWWQANRSHCYLRIGESTHPVAEHLRLDLTLGRRERPALALTATTGNPSTTPPPELRIPVWLGISNDSLVWAEKVRVGAVGYGASIAGPQYGRALGGELRARLNIPRSRTLNAVGSKRPTLEHVAIDVADLGPLDAMTQHLAIVLPRCNGHYVWTGAIYVTSPAAGLSMFTISVWYADTPGGIEVDAGEVTVQPSEEHRPLVWWGARDAWEDLAESDRAIG